MVFNFGAWDAGVDKSKEEFSKRRAENAALYADYIKNNPDASVASREAFKNNLAGNSKFLQGALPSRADMEANVTRRKQQLAAAAAARKQAALKQNIALAGQLAGVYGSAYVSGGEEAAMSAVQSLAGGVLPEAAMPLVKQFGRDKAQQIVNERMQPKFDLWKTAGASASDIKAWETTVAEGARDLLNPWVQQAQATIKGLQTAQEQQALSNSVAVINTGDEVKVQNYISNLSTLYPHLGDRAATVTSQINQNFGGFQTAKQQKIQTAVNTAVETAALALRNGETTSVDSAALSIVAEARKVDPTFTDLDPTSMRILERALDERLHQQNNALDVKESVDIAAQAAELRGASQFVIGGGKVDRTEIQKEAVAYATAYETEDVDKEVLAAQATAAVEKFAGMNSVALSDEATWKALTQTALSFAGESGQSPSAVSDSLMRSTVDRVMANRNDPQAQAHKAALRSLGVSSLEEANTSGLLSQFPAAYDEALTKVIEQAKDVYEGGVYTPQLVAQKIKEDVDAAKLVLNETAQPGENGMSLMETAQKEIIDVTPTPETLSGFVGKVYDTELALSGQRAKVEDAIAVLQDRKRRATIRLQAPEFQTSEMYPRVQTAMQSIASIDQEIAALTEVVKTIEGKRRDMGGKLLSSIQGAARPNEANLTAIAEAIGPLAMHSANTSEGQLTYAKGLIQQAIPEMDGINPGIYARILEDMVKVNLGYMDELPENTLAMIERLAAAENRPPRPAAPVVDSYGVPQSYYPPVEDGTPIDWFGGGNPLPDDYQGWNNVDYTKF